MQRAVQARAAEDAEQWQREVGQQVPDVAHLLSVGLDCGVEGVAGEALQAVISDG